MDKLELFVMSPYSRAKIERLAREAGVSVEKFASVFFERLAKRAFDRAEKGNTNLKKQKAEAV